MNDPKDAAPVSPEGLQLTLRPFGTSRGLPRESYLAQEVLRWELERLFDDAWVCVARTDELAEPGTQRAVRAGAEGVLLVRDTDAVRGFFNVCPHRAHELVQIGEHVKIRHIRCPYHGWLFGLDGSLLAARRDEEGRCDGLIPLRVETWRGFVFVNVSGGAAPLSRWIGELDELAAGHDLQGLRAAQTHTYELAANWKLVFENYHECYHCPQIHPQLCRVTQPLSGRNFDRAGAWVGGPMELSPHAETMSLDGKSRGRSFSELTPAQRRQVFYYGLCPNLLLSLHPDYVMTHRLEPLAPDRTRIVCQWLFAPDVLATPGFSPAYAVDFWDMTNRQDWCAVESVQRGVASRGYRPGVFTAREPAVHEFVTRVARSYLRGGWDGPDGPEVRLTE